jgi:hypothetical protein
VRTHALADVTQLYTGKPPFSDIASDFSVLQYVSQGVRPARPSDMPDDLWAVVSQCWGVKDSRLSMSEVVEKMKPATLDFSFRSEPLLDF